MAYPKITTMYECSKCHKIYMNEEDAVKCEESHKCPCEKWDFCRIGIDEHYGEVFVSGIYFKEKAIKLMINDDGTIYDRDLTKINYCPFCGRELKDSDSK